MHFIVKIHRRAVIERLDAINTALLQLEDQFPYEITGIEADWSLTD